MPKPIFDIEQYELRNLVPEVYTPEQQAKLNATLARVNGQIDWTAQLLGFSGPNYWGRPDLKSDGTYNWKGLPETINQKRRLQTGAFGVYGKTKSYGELPPPFNRSDIAASGDASFHIFEEDGKTILAPLGQTDGVDYMHDPVIFAGGAYLFDAQIEVEGREVDVDNFVQYYSFLESNSDFTRLRTLSESMGGSLLIRIKGSSARPVAVEILKWEDISDWNTTTIKRQFIGIWGNKGNQLSADFAFDALDLYGNDEKYSLTRATTAISFTPEELLKRAGLKTTFWSNISADLYRFSSEGCSDWSAVHPYIGGPTNDLTREPRFVDDEVKFFDCAENCDYNLTITQVMSTVETYDNGAYVSFENSTTPPTTARPTEGFTDFEEKIFPITTSVDNGFVEADPPPSGRIEEGVYDRNPWKEIERFDIRYTPKTDYGVFLPTPCLEWRFNPELNNGDFNDFEYKQKRDCELDYGGCSVDGEVYKAGVGAPPLVLDCDYQCPDVDNLDYSSGISFVGNPVVDGGSIKKAGWSWQRCEFVKGVEYNPNYDGICLPPPEFDVDNRFNGPVATADDGFYDDDTDYFTITGAVQGGLDCEDGAWVGYDDGIYEIMILGSECEETYPGCTANGGTYSAISGSPAFIVDCQWECPPIDNFDYASGDVYTGDIIVDGGYLRHATWLADGCTFVDGEEYPQEYSLDCDCSVECCSVDDGEIQTFYGELTNKIDGQYYTYGNPIPDPKPVPPIPCAENAPKFEPCVIEDLQVDISYLMAALPYEMRPNIRNASVPLRTWKHRPLVIKDSVDTAELEYWNYIEADRGTGPDNTDAFRNFLRLPLNYERNGREWNKVNAVGNNQSYFSSPEKLQKMKGEATQPRPALYAEVYRDKLADSVVMYDEDYLVSTLSSDTESVQPGFEDSEVRLESRELIPFDKGTIVEYDPFSKRVPYADGEWRGRYISLGVNSHVTGHLSTDLKNHSLLEVASLVYDESTIKRPNIVFPGEDQTASAKNYVVSYAYFSCDYSAADDPIFDPDKPHCWRQRVIDSAKPDPDSVVQPRLATYEEYCVEDHVQTHTAYLLHPTA